jgi:hypothetical protein
MPYVVKAVSTGGIVAWLRAPDSSGIRWVSVRDKAEVFPSFLSNTTRLHCLQSYGRRTPSTATALNRRR